MQLGRRIPRHKGGQGSDTPIKQQFQIEKFPNVIPCKRCLKYIEVFHGGRLSALITLFPLPLPRYPGSVGHFCQPTPQHENYFLLGRCVSADAAADLADFPELFELRVLLANEAAFDDVTLVGAFTCERTEAAADFSAFVDFGLLKTFPAALAAFLPVTSLFLLIMQISKIQKMYR